MASGTSSRTVPNGRSTATRTRSWGHRSAVGTRTGGGFYGYKIDAAVCSTTGLPLAWQVRTARRDESLFVAPLIDAVRARGYDPRTVAMDRGYDNNRVMDETRERGCVPIVALPQGTPDPAHRDPLRIGGVEAALPSPRRRRARVRPLEARVRARAAPHPWPRSRSASRRLLHPRKTGARPQPRPNGDARRLIPADQPIKTTGNRRAEADHRGSRATKPSSRRTCARSA